MAATAAAPRIEFVLYTSPNAMLSNRALLNMQRLLAAYETAQVVFTICDVSRNLRAAEADSITFTPTLVRRYPAPRTWILGDLDDMTEVNRMLNAAGVARKSDEPTPMSFRLLEDDSVVSL